MIPRVVHFVFGLKDGDEPFHFVHYLSVESCRRVLNPDRIYFHYKNLPWGPWWDRISPYLTLVKVDLAEEVLAADYTRGHVPPSYRYAHHADFIRLDALIEYGGIYADIDMLFVRPFPDELFDAPFVIGTEPPVRDEVTGEWRPSLCNALLMAEHGSLFARVWRQRMAGALNGTWSNHSGYLSQLLSEELVGEVRVEPEVSFFSFPATRDGLSQLFEERRAVPPDALSIHLWAHLWWQRGRRDFSLAHAGWCTPSVLRHARTTFADLARPYLPEPEPASEQVPGTVADTEGTSQSERSQRWVYLSLDDETGYGVAADRCMAALEGSGLELDWVPFVPGHRWGLSYDPPPSLDPFENPDAEGLASGQPTQPGPPGPQGPQGPQPGQPGPQGPQPGQVVVAHLVPEYLPLIRERCPQAFLVGHTVWETDRIPAHWVSCLNSADLIVVPSQLSAESIESSPVSTPVAIVPHATWTSRPKPSTAWDAIPPDLFVFYTIADWNERKAVALTIEAYLRAFSRSDPVLLVVKTSHRVRGGRPPTGRRAVEDGTSAWALAQILARHRDLPAINLVTRVLSDEDISGLHERGDCYVSLCRSEGWGVGAFDAAASGVPVVTTAFGGHLDYLGGSPYLVDFKLVPVEDPAGFPSYAPDQRWAEPDADHGAALMREVLAHRHEVAAEVAPLAEAIRWRYRPEAIAAAFRSAVDTHRGVDSHRVVRTGDGGARVDGG